MTVKKGRVGPDTKPDFRVGLCRETTADTQFSETPINASVSPET
jgi:hypothetical protein